jgi:beta-1,4-mannosyl-glycoprotein beta-1,4-N-acetylglucosaminyltransferase
MGSRFGPNKWIKGLLVIGTLFCIARILTWGQGGNRHVIRVDAQSTLVASSPNSGYAGAGLLNAKERCQQLGWQPFRPRKPKSTRQRKVYDLFMVNTELDWLEIRLNSTYDEVDHFVIVEGRTSFQGNAKPLTIKENWHRLAPYKDKVIYHELEHPADFNPQRTWDYEDFQRNAMLDQVFPTLDGDRAPAEGDVIIVADVDEIVRPATLRALRECEFPRRLTLRSKFYYYGFQWLHEGVEWQHPQATYYEGSQTIKPVNLRNGDGGLGPVIWLDKANLWNSGWHCSSCFATMAELLGKMSSFSHASLNDERYRDRDRLADRVRSGQDLWDRKGENYVHLANNTDIPPAVLADKARFRYLWDRSGQSAGFRDYPP